MAYTEKNVKKATTFISKAIDEVRDFVDDNTVEDASDETKANLGMILAAVAISEAMKHLSFSRVLRLYFGAYMAAIKLKKMDFE